MTRRNRNQNDAPSAAACQQSSVEFHGGKCFADLTSMTDLKNDGGHHMMTAVVECSE